MSTITNLWTSLVTWWTALSADVQHLIIVFAEIVGVMMVVIVCVAFLTLLERKIIGWMQVRIGPNQIRIFGLPFLKGVAQPFADVIKLLLKEVLLPAKADKVVFLLAPLIALTTALATWGSCRSRRCSCWPTWTPGSSTYLRSPRSACTASSSPAGPRTRSTPCSARCARRRRSSPMRSRWASRSSAC